MPLSVHAGAESVKVTKKSGAAHQGLPSWPRACLPALRIRPEGTTVLKTQTVLIRIAIVALFIGDIVWWSIGPVEGNARNIDYRRDERMKAFNQLGMDRSPASRAVFETELRLASEHQMDVHLTEAVVVLLADAALAYLFWNPKGQKRRFAAV